ncbi:excisionase family DNA-binding protein [Yinghuangia seranimata]|uniref:excisionase family DNA-binding protein n=1 Tax=Yinghuangia seranimata TaxID=408067 RepID=UPI00248B5D11|nr:excisionase family DNA-binding protein [Yinghuangia seranimata]MDI2130822.1 excisionase family DNA-binding protein [Yinghuangia seranimata]
MNEAQDRLLSVVEVAELLGTTERFPRRLIAERRIAYVKVGSHVRIRQSVVDSYLAANTVEPAPPRRRRAGYRRSFR